jgi:hypothetical protein
MRNLRKSLEAKVGIGLISSLLRGQCALFYWLLKHNRPLPNYTLFNSFGVRFGVHSPLALLTLLATSGEFGTNWRIIETVALTHGNITFLESKRVQELL